MEKKTLNFSLFWPVPQRLASGRQKKRKISFSKLQKVQKKNFIRTHTVSERTFIPKKAPFFWVDTPRLAHWPSAYLTGKKQPDFISNSEKPKSSVETFRHSFTRFLWNREGNCLWPACSRSLVTLFSLSIFSEQSGSRRFWFFLIRWLMKNQTGRNRTIRPEKTVRRKQLN